MHRTHGQRSSGGARAATHCVRVGRLLAAAIVMLASGSRGAAAQMRSRLDLGGMIETGGEEERYLRVLQVAGLAPLGPWSIQPFSPGQTAALRVAGAHPWRERFDSAARAALSVLRPKARLIANSAFPFQDGSGPTWAGRGLTGEIQAGIGAKFPHLAVQLAPLAFVSQNAAFTLAPNGQTGALRFADARYPTEIDAPQRFGDAAYSRLSPGSSSIVSDAFGLVAGISSAPQRWGPSREYPLVLGPNAGGFPEVFFGSSEPVSFWLFKAHARLLYGALGQSSIARPVRGERTRLGSGLVVTVLPRGVNGLEIGASRFLDRPWEGWPAARTLFRPFAGVISNNGPGSRVNDSLENQNASVFARWVLPAARTEVYGEMYREDFPGGFHRAASTLVEKPDDYSAFTLGFQHVLGVDERTARVVRAEIVNGETSHQERGQRGLTVPLPIYIHSPETQGHTLNGLILGSPEAYGGAAWRAGYDSFTPAGRRSLTLERSLRFDWLPTATASSGIVQPDVIYDVRAEVFRFAGSRDYGVTLIPAVDLNRDLVAGRDVFNLTVAVTVRGWP